MHNPERIWDCTLGVFDAGVVVPLDNVLGWIVTIIACQQRLKSRYALSAQSTSFGLILRQIASFPFFVFIEKDDLSGILSINIE
jgi:hypothetical protein